MSRMTQGEARQKAASLVLEAIAGNCVNWSAVAADHGEDLAVINAEVRKIETMVRRLAIGSDRILGKRMEKELGHQVRMPKGRRP